MPIDQKYRFIGYNPSSANIHTEHDAVMFLAKDKAFLEALPYYRAACVRLGADLAQLEAVDLLIKRVEAYQQNVDSKVPDVVGNDETTRVLQDRVK